MKFNIGVILTAAVMLLTGCLGIRQAQPPIEYYTPEYDPPNIGESAPLPLTLKIEPFVTSPVYDSTRIAYTSRNFKRNEYATHRWRAVPGELVGALLARDFAHASLFKAVVLSESVPACSHLLTGTVEEFYLRSDNDRREAVLSVSITLSSLMSKDVQDAVLFQKRYAYREICLQQTPEAFVEAMSRALRQLSAHSIPDVYQRLIK